MLEIVLVQAILALVPVLVLMLEIVLVQAILALVLEVSVVEGNTASILQKDVAKDTRARRDYRESVTAIGRRRRQCSC